MVTKFGSFCDVSFTLKMEASMFLEISGTNLSY